MLVVVVDAKRDDTMGRSPLMDAGRIRLALDLDLAGTAIAGELTPPGGAPRPFTGYAGLIAAVEAIRDLQGNGAGPNATDGIAPGPRQRGDSA